MTKPMKEEGEETMRGKYLNPKADLTFKLVFGQHKDLVCRRQLTSVGWGSTVIKN